MKLFRSLLVFTGVLMLAATAFSQSIIVVNDPTVKAVASKPTAAEKKLFDTAMPAARLKVGAETCDESADIAGVARGSFTKAGVKQSLIFYQYCQTGNGLGWVGLVVIEGNKVVGNFVDEGGWSMDIARVPDINADGIDEFALSYGGGMHQGQGGVGVDVMEWKNGKPVALGWYQAEAFDESDAVTVWKLTAKAGKSPIFYRQKYTGVGEKYRKVGASPVFKLKKSTAAFEAAK